MFQITFSTVDIAAKLAELLTLGGVLLAKDQEIMAHLDRITESVRNVNTKADSLITLVHGMAEKIRELSTDPAALNALADELDAQSGELQAAIDANTPQEPTPTPTPET